LVLLVSVLYEIVWLDKTRSRGELILSWRLLVAAKRFKSALIEHGRGVLLSRGSKIILETSGGVVVARCVSLLERVRCLV